MLSEVDISLNIQSNVSYPVTIDILGNPYNLLDTTNATTEYQWDVTSFTFTNESYVVIQYQINGASSFSSYTQILLSQTLQGVVDALNGLGIGFFSTYTQLGQTYISTYNDNYTFGQLNIYATSIINPSFFYGTAFDAQVLDIATQTDGKIICVGLFSTYQGISAPYVVRLNTDGSIDTSFVYGIGFDNFAQAVSIQSDGKILIGGSFTTYNGTAANRIIRLNTNGSVDATFVYGTGFSGGAGTTILGIGIQTDGKIVLGGAFTTYNGTLANNIIRVNSNGSVDGTFVYGTGLNSQLNKIAIQTDGKIVIVGGFTSYDGNAAVYIARINTNGSIDALFTGAFIAFGTYAVAIQTDGKILVGGDFSDYNGTPALNIVRINTDSTIDTSFVYGSGFNGNNISTISLQNDGKIIAGGLYTDYNGTTANNIIRLNSNGSVDTTWDYGSGFDNQVIASSISQSNGVVSVGGSFNNFNATPANYIIQLSI